MTMDSTTLFAPAQFWLDLWRSWLPMAPGWPAAAPGVGRFPEPWPGLSPAAPWTAWWDYWIDACQRSVLFWDVMRRRGNAFIEHEASGKPPVLTFESEIVLDGRTLPKPVNYFLLRILPPAGTTIDPTKRPFVVVDPRAGHGPGIGGFKPESEIGVAFAAGHCCYFIGFLPRPVPGQTIEDIVQAQALFLERVIADGSCRRLFH